MDIVLVSHGIQELLRKCRKCFVTNYDIWNNNPEKVLQASADFIEKKIQKQQKAVMKAF